MIRLVLSFLDDPRVPSSAITILAHRTDSRFVECLVRKIGAEPSPAIAANLKRIDNVAWLQSEPALLERLDDAGQFGAVQLAVRSGMNRRAVYKMIEFLLRRGNDGGRTGRVGGARAIQRRRSQLALSAGARRSRVPRCRPTPCGNCALAAFPAR